MHSQPKRAVHDDQNWLHQVLQAQQRRELAAATRAQHLERSDGAPNVQQPLPNQQQGQTKHYWAEERRPAGRVQRRSCLGTRHSQQRKWKKGKEVHHEQAGVGIRIGRESQAHLLRNRHFSQRFTSQEVGTQRAWKTIDFWHLPNWRAKLVNNSTLTQACKSFFCKSSNKQQALCQIVLSEKRFYFGSTLRRRIWRARNTEDPR